MEINYLVILGCGVLSMVVGAVWYGPLFGKQWMMLNDVDPNNAEAKKAMQQGMATTFVTQFLLTLFQLWVLALYIKGAADEMDGLSNALWIWAGFVVPTLAAAVLWTTESTGRKWTRFLIQAGFQLVMFALFGYILMNFA